MLARKQFFIVVTLSIFAGFAHADLVGHWKLDKDPSDSSSYGNDGTIYGTPSWDTTEKIGQSLILDGDDHVEMDVTSYKGVLGTQSRTCAAWVKATGTGAIVSWGDSGTTGGWWLFWVESGGRLRLQCQGGSIVGSTDLRDGAWHHAAAVLDSDGTPDNDEVKLYLDGIEETYSSITTHPIDTVSGNNVTIGAAYSGGSLVVPFTGQIDDARIYNRALSEDEIQALEAMGN